MKWFPLILGILILRNPSGPLAKPIALVLIAYGVLGRKW